MADLRDRYRRDYRSVPISTPPRPVPPRRNVSTPGEQPVAPLPTPASSPLPTPSKPPEPAPISQPSQAQAVPKNPSESPKKAHKAKKQRRKGHVKKAILIPLLIILLVGVLAGAGYGGWRVYAYYKPAAIPKSFIQAANYPLYYPQNLPQGYYVDKTTFNNQDNAFVFTIKNTSDQFKTVEVSEQALPVAFNPDRQLPDNPAGPGSKDHKFTTDAGKVEIATWQDRLVASLGTPKTWVIMNISTVPSADADAIAKSFQPLASTPVWLHNIEKKLHINASFLAI